jgi:hemerythrin-like domain-containing protein
MNSSHAIQVLEAEHQVILKAAGSMAVLADSFESHGMGDLQLLRDLVAFMRGYVDGCHHAKEEAVLFPALEAHGVPTQGCPIGALLHEHQKGRTLTSELDSALQDYANGKQDTARRTVVRCLRDLAVLLPSHTWKEDYLLFPMTHKVLSAAEIEALEPKFEAVETQAGREAHQRFEEIAERLHQEAIGLASR